MTGGVVGRNLRWSGSGGGAGQDGDGMVTPVGNGYNEGPSAGMPFRLPSLGDFPSGQTGARSGKHLIPS